MLRCSPYILHFYLVLIIQISWFKIILFIENRFEHNLVYCAAKLVFKWDEARMIFPIVSISVILGQIKKTYSPTQITFLWTSCDFTSTWNIFLKTYFSNLPFVLQHLSFLKVHFISFYSIKELAIKKKYVHCSQKNLYCTIAAKRNSISKIWGIVLVRVCSSWGQCY